MTTHKQADKISTLVKAASVTVEPYWAPLFASLLERKNIEDLITNVGGEHSNETLRLLRGFRALAPAACCSSFGRQSSLTLFFLSYLSLLTNYQAVELPLPLPEVPPLEVPPLLRKPRRRNPKRRSPTTTWDSAFSIKPTRA